MIDREQELERRARRSWREFHGASFLVFVFLLLVVAGLAFDVWEFVGTVASLDGEASIDTPNRN
jgi:hypothetical protein